MKLRQLIKANSFGKFKEYSPGFIEFCKEHKIKLPNLNSKKGQVAALLTCESNRNKYVTRKILDTFLNNIGDPSKDCIQAVNKTDQWGLVHVTEGGQYYKIPFPFQYEDLHIRKRNVSKITDRDEQINLTRDMMKTDCIDPPNKLWHRGHKDPDNPDSSEANLVWQAPWQSKQRDFQKFDDYGLIKCPTVKELKRNFNEYYKTDREKKELFEFLKKELGTK